MTARKVAGHGRRAHRPPTTQATINLLALAPYSGDAWLRLPAVVAMKRRAADERMRLAAIAHARIPVPRRPAEGVARARGHL